MHARALCVAILLSALASGCVDGGGAGSDELTGATADAALCDAINQYRLFHGLPTVPVSPALMQVARDHVQDLSTHGTGGAGCNLHSWTASSHWSGCCYTADNAQAACMWNKPR